MSTEHRKIKRGNWGLAEEASLVNKMAAGMTLSAVVPSVRIRSMLSVLESLNKLLLVKLTSEAC